MSARPARSTDATTTAQAVLNAALAALTPPANTTPCQRRHGERWTSDNPDEREWAALHCRACPVLTLCAAVAEENREKFHVFGGVDRTRTRTPPAQTSTSGTVTT